MTDKVENGSGGEANANQNQKNQSAVNAETEMPDWAKALNDKVDAIAGQQRNLQSDQDTRVSGLQKQFDEAQSTFESAFDYAKKFEDPAEAERAWFIDQQIAQSKASRTAEQDLSQQNQNLAGGTSGADTVDPELLKSMGVDPQSAEYMAQVAAGKVGYEAAMNVLAARQTQNPEGAATGASGGAGGSTTSETTQQQVLRDQYNAELDEAQKQNRGVLHPNSLYSIQVKYAQLGLKDLI